MEKKDLQTMLERLHEEMQQRDVVFSYATTSGDTRVAVGTLQPDKLPQTLAVIGHNVNPNIFVYWDVERQGWRSFRRENLQAVDLYGTVEE